MVPVFSRRLVSCVVLSVAALALVVNLRWPDDDAADSVLPHAGHSRRPTGGPPAAEPSAKRQQSAAPVPDADVDNDPSTPPNATSESDASAAPTAEPAFLAEFVKARRRRKYSANEKPRSTMAAGFGDQCFAKWPQRVTAHVAAVKPPPPADESDRCLPDYNDTAASRCIDARRDRVLAALDARGWRIEAWYMAGRRAYLDITPHYLKPMLRAFGGVAAKVVWLHEEPQTYVPRFAKDHFGDLIDAGLFEVVARGNIRRMYRRSITAPTTLVAKFDDDTAFIEPHALTAIFAELLDDASRCIVVGGNTVNHVGLNPVHALLGALNVSNATEASPISVGRHRMRYDGYQRDVLGSFQEPVEWRQAHVDVLRAIRDGRLDRFYFPPTAGARPLSTAPSDAPASLQCVPSTRDAGAVFDFQCDGMWRRWGINFIAFPPLEHGHFAAMRDLGHLVKNKDEVYFTMEMGRRVRGARNHSCAVADAIAVHFLNTGQASNVRKALGLSANGEGKDPRVRDASLLAPELVTIYREVAEHYGGVKPCCRSSGCKLFIGKWSEDPNVLLKLP